MDRHVVRIESGDCVVEGGDERVTVGSLDAVVRAIGGETYVLEYDAQTAMTPWLSTDDEGRITVDVRSALGGLPLPAVVSEELAELSGAPDEPESERIRYFATVVRRIWDAKGGLDPEELADVEPV